MHRMLRCIRARGPSLALLTLALAPRLADAQCAGQLEVLGASATYQTRTFQGRPQRRDVSVQVELRSTATTAISGVDLGVFLGASLQAMHTTRAPALPTSQLREFDDGGVAFRVRTELMLPPGATRKVTVERRALPLEDLYGVKAVVVGCTRLQPVSDVQVVMPAASDGPPSWILAAAVLITLATAVILLLRLR